MNPWRKFLIQFTLLFAASMILLLIEKEGGALTEPTRLWLAFLAGGAWMGLNHILILGEPKP